MAASQVGGLMEGDPGPILAGLGSSFLFLQRWGLWFYHLNRLDLWRWFIQYNTVLFHSELSSGTSLWNIYICIFKYWSLYSSTFPQDFPIFQYDHCHIPIFSSQFPTTSPVQQDTQSVPGLVPLQETGELSDSLKQAATNKGNRKHGKLKK
jgi:hypothetical protein